jgi:hypothetical protein
VGADAGDGTTHITTRVQRDESTLEIEQEGDGPIIVRRITVDDSGNEETVESSYATAEELQTADEEAYDIYSRIQTRDATDLDLPGVGDLRTFRFKLDDLAEQQGQWREEAEKSMVEARKAFEEAMKQLDDSQVRLKLRGLPGMSGFAWHSDEVTHSFDVDTDGRIEIRLRKGDSEVIMNYESAADLERRNPEMYEKFADVIESAKQE